MQLTDEQIVQRTLEGEIEAFSILVRRWEKKVYGLAYRMLGQYEDARDASQEIFLTVYRNLSKFRGDAKFSSWLYRIALNCCHNRLRERTMVTVPLEETELVVAEETIQGDLERKERVDRVRKALGALPYEMRQIIIMKEYEGLTFKEIAEILNIPVSTAKTRLYTGLDQLRQRLLAFRDAI
ncbi:MAG: sigma-70 family RNA polymerase sigma factor [Acidobacteria bacterium]|nr:sigma-70 family RNA polymerase sigma factor [Acidobacteriota bacterium]